MYISVIPLARSLHPRPYTYSVSLVWAEQVSVGCLVEIPIGKNVERGIIAEVSLEMGEIGDIEVRPIVSVISSTCLLSRREIEVTIAISEQYLIPIHKVLGFFLPAPLLSRLDKRNYLLTILAASEMLPNPKKSQTIHHYFDTIFSPKDLETYLEPGVVICFPDDVFALSFCEKIGEKNIGIILSESSTTRKSQMWIDAYEGKYEILVGTRKILYYNLSRYRRLIYVEDAFGMEQYQYPSRIRNLDILRSIADASDIDITIISSSPTLSLLANFRDFQIIPTKSV